MSTAPTEPLHLDHAEDHHAGRKRHLNPVAEDILTIRQVPGASIAGDYQVPQQASSLTEPADEYAPERVPNIRVAHSNIVYLRKHGDQDAAERRHLEQRDAIKKMTQTIGAAFVEAELGLRSFVQLSSWMELELFQKLRARVERTVNGNYLAAQRHERGGMKVPTITPIGVRASVRENGDWESSMTIRVGQRARAIAMRLQLHRERWKVTAFEIG